MWVCSWVHDLQEKLYQDVKEECNANEFALHALQSIMEESLEREVGNIEFAETYPVIVLLS